MKKVIGKKSKGISRNLKIAITSVAAVAAAGAGGFLLSSAKSKPFEVPAYYVERVIDGDTFVTKEKQIIRVASTEAPEMGLCGSQEAKKALERLIIGKPVYLKVLYTDPYRRFVSMVYTPDGLVNETMLRKGYSYLHRKTSEEDEKKLNEATNEARGKKRGIFGKTCTQDVNEKNPSCGIKGNIGTGKYYFTPSCGKYYDQTRVQLYLGDQWFCTEKQALSEGFRKSSQCP